MLPSLSEIFLQRKERKKHETNVTRLEPKPEKTAILFPISVSIFFAIFAAFGKTVIIPPILLQNDAKSIPNDRCRSCYHSGLVIV